MALVTRYPITMTSQTINLTILKKYFKDCSKEDLEKDITEIFRKYSAIKEYYQTKLLPQADTEMIAKYKKSKRDACGEMLVEVEKKMREVTLNAPSYKELKQIYMARSIYMPTKKTE